jgi:hypothetical protein
MDASCFANCPDIRSGRIAQFRLTRLVECSDKARTTTFWYSLAANEMH